MAATGRELDELAGVARDLSAGAGQRARARARRTTGTVPAIAGVDARVEARLDGQGRLLVRYSGTEPLLRIMLEGRDQDEIRAWAERDRRRGPRQPG